MILAELKLKLKVLAELRQDIQISNEYLAECKAEYEATEAYKRYKNAAETKAELVKRETELSEVIKSLGLEACKQTNWENRAPILGINVKKFSNFILKDETAAKDWATKNKPSVLNLNMTELKKAVKELELPWFTLEDEYKAQIDSDLSQYLK